MPLDRQYLFAGWPDRLQARMAKAGARVVMTGPDSGTGPIRGFDLPEQVREIPVSFVGTVWIDDIWVMGPAFHPEHDSRAALERTDSDALLERRRAARK